MDEQLKVIDKVINKVIKQVLVRILHHLARDVLGALSMCIDVSGTANTVQRA